MQQLRRVVRLAGIPTASPGYLRSAAVATDGEVITGARVRFYAGAERGLRLQLLIYRADYGYDNLLSFFSTYDDATGSTTIQGDNEVIEYPLWYPLIKGDKLEVAFSNLDLTRLHPFSVDYFILLGGGTVG